MPDREAGHGEVHAPPPGPMRRVRRSRTSIWVVGLLGALLAACDSSPTAPPRIEDATFAQELGVNLTAMTRTASGLYLQNLVEGSGPEVGAGSWVSLRYTGWLVDGTEFDSNLDAGDPLLRFNLGGGGVIPGFGEGVRGMRVGGRRLLVVPPSLGYGADGIGPVPGNAILVFSIELVELE